MLKTNHINCPFNEHMWAEVKEPERKRYLQTLSAISFLAGIANQKGWKIPKNRFDLRCSEIVNDKKFVKTLTNYLLKGNKI